MEFSKYQQDIFNWVKTGTGNALIEAAAGAAKSTTLLECTKLIPRGKQICFLAFNKSIAEEMKKKVPNHIQVSTFHALGWKAINNQFKGALLDDKKVYTAIQEFFKKKKIKIADFGRRVKISNNIKKIVDLLRLNFIVGDVTQIDAEDICKEYDIEELDQETVWAVDIFNVVIEDLSCFDFVDMIFMPIYKDFDFPQFDWMLMDESQDSSEVQQRIFFKCLKKDGRFIAVGDEFQQIYGHLGASPEAFNNLRTYANIRVFPLSISYRCPLSVIKWAQKLVPHIEHWDKKGEGEVVHHGSIENVKDGDVVLCRTNFPLASLAGKFLRENKKVVIRGSDIGKNLIKLLENVKGTELRDCWEYLFKKLAKIEKEILEENSCLSPKEQPEYQVLDDKIKTLKSLSENCENKADLISKIGSIFSDNLKSEGITLSTVHKFKGDQRNNVFIIEPQLIPFPYYLHIPGQKEVERNIDYVARTRAIEKLEYVKDWTAYGKD